MTKWKFFPAVLIAIALLLMHFYNVSNAFRQKTVWTGPYLSAAANLTWPLDFKIDVEEIKRFNTLDDTRQEDRYRFKKSGNLTSYMYNDMGYVYLVWAARHIFPFLGDQQAVILLQALIHWLLCSLLVGGKSFSRPWRVGFFLLYAVNPLVLKYVVFNHYYFWQAVPSLLIVMLSGNRAKPKGSLFGIMLLPWAILARITTFLVFPIILYLIYRHASRLTLILTLLYCSLVWGAFYKPSQKNGWHTAYIGTGAYQNPYGIALSDEAGPKLYQERFGVEITGSTGGNLYEPEIYQRYRTLSREVFLEQLAANPVLYLKNAAVNTLEAFSLGYLSGKPDWVNYILAFSGLLVLLCFVYARQWLFLVSIALLSLPFTLYYPPIPAYMYGNYALLGGGLLMCFLKLRPSRQASVLYLSFNDGSDMRVNKEVRTMILTARVALMALGPDPNQCYAADSADPLIFVKGNRKSASTLIRYFGKSTYQLLFRRYKSVHLINEPQLIVLWPFLWLQERVVLDIFDSVFLRKNRPGNQWQLLKRLVYAPVSRCLVTDENRWRLLPDFMQEKALVVPNYPYKKKELPLKERTTSLVVLYYGWLGENRGTATARGLLEADADTKIIMAGWLADEPSRLLTQHPQVEWLGVLPQDQATDLAARRADYILCVYAPTNDNNINASPNKIYDAIQTRTPLIINGEVNAASFVQEHRIGTVLPRYQVEDYGQLTVKLLRERAAYVFDESLRESFIWERVEAELLAAHGWLPVGCES